ncbi:DUF11 domain-containing protein [Candidatus Woesearchaeota archaeon]|nr:DUF11 domain-containing protein [Candidatus Woesearchaeota archaeon]USN44226.1 MAG: DUF11 domain-containing protein [Candidatus Woesearchaeota archaeon]
MGLYLRFSFFFSLVVLLFSCSVFAVKPEITIIENSTIAQLPSAGQYSLVADGIFQIYNPSNVSRIIEVRVPLGLDALIGIDWVNVSPSSSRFNFSYGVIKSYFVDSNETVSVGYHMYGLLSSNLYSLLNGKSVFEYYADSIDLTPEVKIHLEKPEQGIFNESFPESRDIRAGVRNPTEFDLFAKSVKIYRSNVSLPFFDDGTLLTTLGNFSIAPFGFETRSYFDLYSTNDSVYWTSLDVVTELSFVRNVSSVFVPLPSSGGEKDDKGSSGSSGGGFSTPSKEEESVDLLVKKDVNTTVVRYGDMVSIMVTIANVNNKKLANLSVLEEIPEGYELVRSSLKYEVKNGLYVFALDGLDVYESYTLVYTLQHKRDGYRGITYLKPSRVDYENASFYSEGVLLVNALLPEEKIFVQKEVKFVDDDFARVTIKVRNLGGVPVEDLLVSDFIDENAIVKDISQVFSEKRGVWKIKKLESGEEWEVSYLVERNSGLDSLPNVFGVDKSSVFGTIVSSEEVMMVLYEGPGTIEKVGLGVAVGILVFYLLF